MYNLILSLHDIIRWLVLISGALAVIFTLIGWLGKKIWTSRESKLGLLYTMSLDIQALLGLLLYFFFSPYTTPYFSNFGLAMREREARFFLLEHVFWMLLAIVMAHLGKARGAKAETDAKKFKNAAIFYTLSFIFLLIAIPWWRPLLPF
ncbi:MAG: hypothetical protein GXP42_10835 [Chloroflexi bacterium]|nr:hypothetical protein [Chloroflexota bacterium]